MKRDITAIWHKAQPLIAAALLCLALNSCAKEITPPAEEQLKEYAEFSLELTPPGAFTPAGTRMVSDAEQNAINRAEVLVFQNNILLYHKTGAVTDIGGVQKQVKVNLKTSKTESDLFDIMVIGNPPASFDFAPYVDQTKDDLKADFNGSTSGKWAGNEFVMYGEAIQTLIKPTTNNFKIQMLRSLARIDVGVGAYNEATDSWAGLTGVFTLAEVRVVNSRDKFAVIPATTTFNESGNVKVSTPTIPAGTAAQGTTAATALAYSGADIISGTQLKSSIFIAEAPNTTDKVTLLIGGSYQTGATTYYRVDMCAPSASTPGSYDYFNILRNHLYRISITSVSGAGFTTAEEALISAPINITTTLTPIEEGGFGDVIFDGNNYLMTDVSELPELALSDGIKSSDLFTVKAVFAAGGNATVTGPGLTTPITLTSGVSKLISAVIPITTTSGQYTITAGRLVKKIPFNVIFKNGFIPNWVLTAGGWPEPLLLLEGGLQLAPRGDGVLPGGVAADDDPVMLWKATGTSTAGTDAALGFGSASTIAMAGAVHPAAQYCRDMGEGWFLPSRDELSLIYNNKSSLGAAYAFTANSYWSSTESDASNAWSVDFNSGATSKSAKATTSNRVRCVKGTMSAAISVTPTAQANIPSGGGKYTVQLTSNYAWSVSSTVSGVSFSPSSGAAGANVSVEVTVPNNTGVARNIPVVFTTTGGGATATTTWTGAQLAAPPIPSITINGLKWTTGNLVANDAYGCKVGAAADYGLYFQFGSLVGWNGGATGDGTGTGEPTLAINVKPSAYTGSTDYTACGYYGDAVTSGSIPSTDDASAGIGDPCRYYLGSPWRTPNATEYKYLADNSGSAWVTSPAAGRNFNTNGSTQLFLPASDLRNTDGSMSIVGDYGYYWSESVHNASSGYYLYFSSDRVYSQDYDNRRFGCPARCVEGALLPPVISLNTTTQASIPSGGNKYTVQLTSNYAWSVSSTVSGVSFTPSSGAAGANVSVEITVPNNTGVARNISVVFTSTDGSTSATTTWTGTQLAVPSITINGLKWTTGNLVANGAYGVKVGAAADYGLYFQFGSLVGWNGGASGDGTGTGSSTALAINVKPSAYTGGTTWATGGYHSTGVAETELPATDDAATGIGDPCRYYLGSPWRTPTPAEFTALNGSGSTWVDSPAKGRNFNTSGSPQLFLPISGRRSPTSGSLYAVGEIAGYWSASAGTSSGGYYLHFTPGFIDPKYIDNRRYGMPVRCVQ